MKHARNAQVKTAEARAAEPRAGAGAGAGAGSAASAAGPRLRVVPAPAGSPERGASSTAASEAPRPVVRGLSQVGMAQIHDVSGSEVVLDLGGELVTAALDPSVHPSVIAGAHARGERVLVEQQGDHLVVLGALRTRPTPGIDAADEYAIEAKRISLRAEEELSLRAQTSALVLRAIGEVETYADRIVSRAESVHKIVGRMLRLN